jgi:hypothetical protein
MIRFRSLSLLLAVAGGLLAAAPAFADEVVLKSGARITGRIIDKSTEALVLETTYSDAVRVAWSDILSLQTDAPQDAMLT